MRKNIALLLLIVLFLPGFVWAIDFGIVLDQNADYGGFVGSADDLADGLFTYSGILIPRVSAMIGDTGDIIVSAGFQAAYSDGWFFVPELLRTEFSFYSGMFGFTVGRMQYSDPLGFIADGLFDGAQFSLTSEAGTFSLGAWYTGLLYKRRANIAMTTDELKSYAIQLDFSDFANTYFAPRRLVAAIGWEHLGWKVKTRLSVLGQADLADGFNFSNEKLLHSQYLIGKASLPGNVFSLDAGGAFSLTQYGGELSSAFAAELGIAVTPPMRIRSRISLLGRYASGAFEGDTFTPFEPFTIKTQGEILNAKLSGLSFISLDYIARLHNTFSVGITSSYFIRNDLKTYSAYPVLNESNTLETSPLRLVEGSGYLLGNEFFARLLWSPLSDMQFNLGGGVFLPSLGNVAPDADMSWRVELNVIIALR